MRFKTFAYSATLILSGDVYFLLHTVFAENYADKVQLYSDGRPKQISATLMKLTEQVLEDVSLTTDLKSKFKFIYVFGADPYSIGMLRSRYTKQAFVGLPLNFEFSNDKDFEKSVVEKMNVCDHPVDWQSETGQNLISSLILSDDAKKFAIARELHFVDSNRVPIQSALISGSLASCLLYWHLTADFRNRYSKSTARQQLLNLTMITVTLVFGLSIYTFATTFLTYFYDLTADEKALSTKNADYFDGAFEYYQKRIQLNESLKEFVDEKLYKHYINKGDYFVPGHLMSTKRLKYLENIKRQSEMKTNSKAQTVS